MVGIKTCDNYETKGSKYYVIPLEKKHFHHEA